MNRRIRIGSITYAQKAKRALSAEGIRAHITKLEGGLEGTGCVYGLEIPAGREQEAKVVLRRAGIEHWFLSHDLF